MNIRVRYILRCLFFYVAEYSFFKRKPTNAKELLIVHTDAIGDYILFRNFISELKQSDKFKSYKITLCGNQAYKELALHFDAQNIDSFVWLNRNKFEKDYAYRSSFFKEMRNKQYDVIINPSYSHDFIFADSIVRQTSANIKHGQISNIANTYKFFSYISNKWYTHLTDTGKNVQFEFDRNKRFCEAIIGQKLSIPKPFIEAVENVERGAYFLLFPGAGEAQKRWSVEHFATCADYVKVKFGMDAIVVGSAQEKELGELIKGLSKQSKISNLCGTSSLIDLIKLIQGASMLLTNDSSALHIAACTNTKAICVGNGRHYGRFTPYPEGMAPNLHFVFPDKVMQMANEDIETLKRLTIQQSIASIHDITVDDVIRLYNQGV